MSTPRRLVACILLALLGLSLGSASAAVAAQGDPELVRDPLAHVDPMIGTGVATGFVGEINNFPGPSMPFGMVQLSPDTPGAYAGYRHSGDRIRGFSLTHASAGCAILATCPSYRWSAQSVLHRGTAPSHSRTPTNTPRWDATWSSSARRRSASNYRRRRARAG